MPIATNGSSIKVSNLKVLKNLACKIANKIKSGETILLYGQLGVGKTTFARFFINYLQKKTNSKITEVPSPTFTVMYEYLANQKLIQHYDFYRVKNYKELSNIGVFEDNEVISLIERAFLMDDINIRDTVMEYTWDCFSKNVLKELE